MSVQTDRGFIVLLGGAARGRPAGTGLPAGAATCGPAGAATCGPRVNNSSPAPSNTYVG